VLSLVFASLWFLMFYLMHSTLSHVTSFSLYCVGDGNGLVLGIIRPATSGSFTYLSISSLCTSVLVWPCIYRCSVWHQGVCGMWSPWMEEVGEVFERFLWILLASLAFQDVQRKPVRQLLWLYFVDHQMAVLCLSDTI
jgi:hypothetical protein